MCINKCDYVEEMEGLKHNLAFHGIKRVLCF